MIELGSMIIKFNLAEIRRRFQCRRSFRDITITIHIRIRSLHRSSRLQLFAARFCAQARSMLITEIPPNVLYETNYWQTRTSRGLSATAGLLVPYCQIYTCSKGLHPLHFTTVSANVNQCLWCLAQNTLSWCATQQLPVSPTYCCSLPWGNKSTA